MACIRTVFARGTVLFWISAAVVLITLTMGRDLEKYAPRVVKG